MGNRHRVDHLGHQGRSDHRPAAPPLQDIHAPTSSGGVANRRKTETKAPLATPPLKTLFFVAHLGLSEYLGHHLGGGFCLVQD